MEMHHKLRRDPSWDPRGCNLCGQLGHMAAMCPNGTVNWKQIYGEEAFRLRPPLYESDLMERRKAKAVDVPDLEKRAREYAERQRQAMEQGGQQQQQQAAAPAAAGGQPQLPPDWGVAHDAAGKPYYWNKVTRQTTWSLDDVMKPAAPAAAPPAAAADAAANGATPNGEAAAEGGGEAGAEGAKEPEAATAEGEGAAEGGAPA